MNYETFKRAVYETLVDIGLPQIAHAQELIIMIAAHESLFGKYSKQVNGPALGWIQMEPATHEHIWDNCTKIQLYADKAGLKKDLDALLTDPRYNAFMARMRMKMDPMPLPQTVADMAAWCKKYWNTEAGKATVEDYRDRYLQWPHKRQS